MVDIKLIFEFEKEKKLFALEWTAFEQKRPWSHSVSGVNQRAAAHKFFSKLFSNWFHDQREPVVAQCLGQLKLLPFSIDHQRRWASNGWDRAQHLSDEHLVWLHWNKLPYASRIKSSLALGWATTLNENEISDKELILKDRWTGLHIDFYMQQ